MTRTDELAIIGIKSLSIFTFFNNVIMLDNPLNYGDQCYGSSKVNEKIIFEEEKIYGIKERRD